MMISTIIYSQRLSNRRGVQGIIISSYMIPPSPNDESTIIQSRGCTSLGACESNPHELAILTRSLAVPSLFSVARCRFSSRSSEERIFGRWCGPRVKKKWGLVVSTSCGQRSSTDKFGRNSKFGWDFLAQTTWCSARWLGVV